MSDHTRRVTASSNWRDSEDGAKDECNRILDIRSDDAIQDEEHDGSYLVGSSYSSYSVETRDNKTLFRCTRSRDLRFREYEKEKSSERIEPFSDSLQMLKAELSPEDFQILESLSPVRLLEPIAETQDEYFARIENKINERLPQTVNFILNIGIATAVIPLPLANISLSGLRITKSLLKLSTEEETVGIPLAESIWRIPAENCGKKIELEINRSVEYEETSGFKVSTEHSISEKLEISGKLTFGDVGELGGTVTREVSFRESKEYSQLHSERRTQDVKVKIPPETNAIIKIAFQTFEVRRAFEGPVTVDCTVVAEYRPLEPGGKPRKEQTYTLSQLFPDESDRSFVMKGYYGTLDTLFMPIKVEDLGCPSTP
jgi:hypothetical protein